MLLHCLSATEILLVAHLWRKRPSGPEYLARLGLGLPWPTVSHRTMRRISPSLDTLLLRLLRLFHPHLLEA